MMIASHFPPGAHPGMAQHGPPGQVGQPGMHIGHPASGPNGPHVAQAGPMMAGMQPGMAVGGPQSGPMSNHALSHLQPGNQMLAHGMNPQASKFPPFFSICWCVDAVRGLVHT